MSHQRRLAFLLTSRNSQPQVSWPGHSLIRSSGPCTSSSAADQATGQSDRAAQHLACLGRLDHRGLVVSWAGTWLWNLASSRLSPAVAGLLVNLETVSGFGYVYAVRQHWPPAGQLAGLALVLAGVTLTLTVSAR